MTRLAEHGLVDLTWSEDDEDGMVYAEGLCSYEIDADNELAIFQGDKCIRVAECVDFPHAVGIVTAHEAVCRIYIRDGCDNLGNKVNERGWIIK